MLPFMRSGLSNADAPDRKRLPFRVRKRCKDLDVSSRLVSITATAAALLFSDRPVSIAIEQRSVWLYGVQLEEGKGPYCCAPQ